MTEPLPEPVGAEFGLDPQRPELHERIVVPPASTDVLTNPLDYTKGTEFLGVQGLVQPPPHIPTAAERRMQIMFIDPADPGTEDGSVAAPDLEGDFQ
jgi:hypothetical protein